MKTKEHVLGTMHIIEEEPRKDAIGAPGTASTDLGTGNRDAAAPKQEDKTRATRQASPHHSARRTHTRTTNAERKNKRYHTCTLKKAQACYNPK